MRGRVLIVAGSDSSGGAGLQADLKTVTAFSAYGMTAVTALTAQDTNGVREVIPVAPAFVELQMRMALADIGADVVKTGMLADAEVIEAVARTLAALAPTVPVVVDPVMVAKGGASLLRKDARDALVGRLFVEAALVTPNAPEATALTGLPVSSPDDLLPAARRLLELGPRAVLLKGGHLEGPRLVDLFLARDGTMMRFEADRVETRSTHGTGCTLASAIAAGLSRGDGLVEAITRGHAFVQGAIRHAPGLGTGHGPLDHSWELANRRSPRS